MGLAGPLRNVAAKLIGGLGAQETIILRTPATGTYSTATGSVARTESDRAVRAVRVKDERTEAGGTHRREITFLLAAKGLYVEAEFRLPHQGDRVVAGCDEVYGDDDNPGWDGGLEYEVASIDSTTVAGEDVMYSLVVQR